MQSTGLVEKLLGEKCGLKSTINPKNVHQMSGQMGREKGVIFFYLR